MAFICFAFVETKSIDPKSRTTDSVSEIKIIELKESKGIIFPSAYSKKLFIEDSTDTIIGFFTPDESTIKYIDENLSRKYFAAVQKFNNQWKDLHDKTYSKAQTLKSKKEAQRVIRYDKQFFGYINAKKEKIIVIQLFDFSEDPLNVRTQIVNEYIIGYHGWFETNVSKLRFHVESKKFTVNEDI